MEKFIMQSNKIKTNSIVVVEMGLTRGLVPTNDDQMAPE